jgi:pimeloyl-ACP methyl ester carboxylesterase
MKAQALIINHWKFSSLDTILQPKTRTLSSPWASLIEVLVAFFLLLSFPARGVQTFNFQVSPSPSDNFLEAAFRYANPNPNKIPQRLLVYVPGTDGDARGVINDPAFLDACRKCDAALIGCYFRGEGLRYDDPSGGSGRALDEALDHFGEQIGQLRLSKLPILLMGFSEGSQFTFNYVCWHPDRIEAFAAIKAGGFAFIPQAKTFRVPGLMVAGQYDEPGRIRATSQAFVRSAGKNSRWAFLFEGGAGHDMTRIKSFALQFLEAACKHKMDDVYRETDTGSYEFSSAGGADLCWFPNRATAESWISLRQSVPLSELTHLPDQVPLERVISIASDPSSFNCVNGQKQEGTLCFSTGQKDVLIQRVSISGPGFSLAGADKGKLPLQTIVSFSPVNLDWGPISASATIWAQQGNHELAPDTITFHGQVEGAASAVPRLLYLGSAVPHEMVRRSILIKLSGPNAHVRQIEAPSDLSVKLDNIENSHDLVLNVAWSSSDRLGSISGEIRVDFDSPQKGVLRIPIVGVVVKPNAIKAF